MRRALALTMVLTLAGLAREPAAGAGGPARSAVEAFVARIAGAGIRDLSIERTITLYHPDGRHPSSRGEQRLLIKPPGRERREEVVEGRREVRLIVGGRTWIRRADGKVHEAPASDAARNQTDMMVPLQRSADELLSAWKTLGVRDDVTDTLRVGGRTLIVIGARTGDRDSPAVWLDPERGVVRLIGRESLPTGPALIDLTFSEHRPLLGAFQFPHRQEMFVDGRLILMFTVRSAIANVGLPDALFDPDALGQGR